MQRYIIKIGKKDNDTMKCTYYNEEIQIELPGKRIPPIDEKVRGHFGIELDNSLELSIQISQRPIIQ